MVDLLWRHRHGPCLNFELTLPTSSVISKSPTGFGGLLFLPCNVVTVTMSLPWESTAASRLHAVPVPEVLDGILEMQDVQDNKEPGPGPPKRDLDPTIHLARVDLVMHDPALDVVPAVRQLDLLALDVDESWLRMRAARQSELRLEFVQLALLVFGRGAFLVGM